MTDEQLQYLFAGMERHLDKRADATDQHVAAAEARILADVKDRVQVLETKLLSEGLEVGARRWGANLDARRHQRGHTRTPGGNRGTHPESRKAASVATLVLTNPVSANRRGRRT